MWTILNQSSAAITVNDIPDPQELLANTSATFELADVTTSRTLAQNLAIGALVVTNMGTLSPAGPWAPVTYPVWTNTGSQTQDGQSPLFTTGVYSAGTILTNVTAVTGTLTLLWQPSDGINDYPAQTLVSATAIGLLPPTSIPLAGVCGRLTFTLSSGGSATFTVYGQMR